MGRDGQGGCRRAVGEGKEAAAGVGINLEVFNSQGNLSLLAEVIANNRRDAVAGAAIVPWWQPNDGAPPGYTAHRDAHRALPHNNTPESLAWACTGCERVRQDGGWRMARTCM